MDENVSQARKTSVLASRHSRRWWYAISEVVLVAGLLALFAGQQASTPASATGIGSVTGVVTGSGSPRSGIKVTVFGAVYGNVVGTVVTDSSGRYSVPAPVGGQVKVRFDDPTWTWAQAYATGAGGSPLTVPASGSLVADIDLVPFGGTFAGKVVQPGSSPVSGVQVDVVSTVYGTAVARTTTDAAGGYRTGAVAPGAYRLKFSDPTGSHVTGWNGGAATFAAAADLWMSSNVTFTVNASLLATRAVSGTVTTTARHAPLAGIDVVVLAPSAPPTIVASSVTGADGSYTVAGVLPGTYKVGFVDPAYLHDATTGVRPVLYPDRDVRTLTPDGAFAAAGLVTVTSTTATSVNQAMTGVDCTMGPGADLSGANLAGKNFAGCDLTGANFTNADLTTTTFTGAELSGARVGGATMAGTLLAGAHLSHVFGAIFGAPAALPFQWRVLSSHLAGPYADLHGVDFSGADFRSVSLVGSDLTHAVLSGANISNVFLTDALLTGVRSGGLIGRSTLPRGWSLVGGYLLGPGADLTDADLANADLGAGAPGLPGGMDSIDLRSSILTGADLTNVNLERVLLAGAISGRVRGVPRILPWHWSLVGGYLVGPGANLTAADLVGADLGGVVLTGANLTLANLSGATLTGVTSGAITTVPAALPAGWAIAGGYLLGPGVAVLGVNLSGADLSHFDLRGAALTYANLDHVVLTGANLDHADLAGASLAGVTSGSIAGTPAALPDRWMLVGGYLIGPGANLADAHLAGQNLTGCVGGNLAGADLTGANLTGCELEGATISGTRFAGADLTRVHSGFLSGMPASLPTNWVLAAGYLAGPGADLSHSGLDHVSLVGVDLAGVDFSSSNLTQTDLGEADLTNTKFAGASIGATNLARATVTGADFTAATMWYPRSGGLRGVPVALPSGYVLAQGYLAGPVADLTNAHLGGADLRGVDLTRAAGSGADLSHADLTQATATNASFTGADLTGANLTGVDFSSSTLDNATLTNANLTNAKFWWATLAGSTIAGANVTGADLGTGYNAVNLTGIRSGGVTGTPAVLPSGWAINSTFLIGPLANLTGANLAGANLTRATLTGANFTDANLSNANLSGASISSANFTRAKLTGANLGLTNASFANLTQADLTGASLWDTRMDAITAVGANFTSVNLAGAFFGLDTLSGVRSGGIKGTPAVFYGPGRLIAGYLVGPRANLHGAKLGSADLSTLDLSGADLSLAVLAGANLTNANLTAASLAAANVTGTNLTGANLTSLNAYATGWSNTTCPDGTNSNAHANTCVGH